MAIAHMLCLDVQGLAAQAGLVSYVVRCQVCV